jgi:hypothetical protein
MLDPDWFMIETALYTTVIQLSGLEIGNAKDRKALLACSPIICLFLNSFCVHIEQRWIFYLARTSGRVQQ